MQVHFLRTGERRYAVRVDRKDFPSVEMNPAPGFDPLIPHDLVHLVVEEALGLRQGIFGQLAAGGGAGTFRLVPGQDGSQKEASRQRRKTAGRDEKLLRDGRRDANLSEQAVSFCIREWLSRSTDPQRRKLASQMAQEGNKDEALRLPSGQAVSKTVLDRICNRLEEASQRWTSLAVGESMTVNWPD